MILRVMCFLACIPSGGALLLKVWGLASMAQGGLLFLACLPVLLGAYAASRDAELVRALRLGTWGGLLGTLGYDVVRVPLHLAGYRVFAPISAYGVWLLDASRSSAWTEAAGWLYHFSNGITFGIMFALAMARKHWGWGMLWGLCLESIVLSTPFARIFHMQGNYPMIAVAYGAHLAYGFPLGYIIWRWDQAETRTVRQLTAWSAVLVGGFLISLLSAPPVGGSTAELVVQGARLDPGWLRLPAPGNLTLSNPGNQEVTVLDASSKREVKLMPGSSLSWDFPRTGIYQCHVKTQSRSISSFIIVDPVETP